MTVPKAPEGNSRDCTLFTLNIDDKIYRCPVSAEALYMLCRDQDASVNQVDAYLQLKMKVQRALERRLAGGQADMPALLGPADFMQ